MQRHEDETSVFKDAGRHRHGRRAIRALLATLTTVCSCVSGCASEPRDKAKPSAPLPPSPADDRQALDQLLAPFHLPDVRELKFVVHCPPGSGIRPAPEWPPKEPMVAGWLIDSSRTEVRLMTADGETMVFGGEKDDTRSPAPWISFERHCDAERGSWTTVEFEEALNWPEHVGLFNPASSSNAYAVRFAVLAHWAFQRGNEKLAEVFLTRLRDLVASEQYYRREAPTWQELLGEEILQYCRRCTNTASRLGAPRIDLLEFWKRFEQSPSPATAEEAGAQVRGYDSLIQEDGNLVEKSAAELAAMPPGQRAEYWVRRIQDAGSTEIVEEGEFISLVDRIPQMPGRPVWELLSLGEDARTALEARLKDDRPTRVERWGHPMSYEAQPLMTCGEVCQILLDALDRRPRYAK